MSLTADIAEMECYIAPDYDTELDSTAETVNFKSCELSDGTSSPSALLQPSFQTRYDIDIRKNLYVNVELLLVPTDC